MNFYQEITLLPGSDITLNFLWGKVYQKIHAGLVSFKDSSGLSVIGVSFPGYTKQSLGNKIRLFAKDKVILEHFDAVKLLNQFTEYSHLTGIRDIVFNKITGYVRFKRVQSKSSNLRLARRKAKREKMRLEDAFDLLKDREQKILKMPFIKIKSHSSSQDFPLFIGREESKELINAGFNCYGLSGISTVPEF